MRKHLLTLLISCLTFVLGMGLGMLLLGIGQLLQAVSLSNERFWIARDELRPKMEAYIESQDPRTTEVEATLFRADNAVMLVGEVNVREAGHVVVRYDKDTELIQYLVLTPLFVNPNILTVSPGREHPGISMDPG